MDWQELAALGIVAVTAAALCRGRIRRRRFSFEKDTHCGCSSSGSSGQPSIVFHARKDGQRSTVIKMK